MKELVKNIETRLLAQERVMLCTILQSEGSSPRETGAKMAVFADGSTCGTVGGGAVERQAGSLGLELLRQGRSGLHEYRLRPNREEDIGMVCGGDVLLGFCCLEPEDAATVAALRAALERAESAWLETAFYPDGRASLRLLREDLHAEGAPLPRRAQLTQSAEKTVLIEPIACGERVWIFGGGHVGAALTPALAAVGFRVAVFDERPDYAVAARYPAAELVVRGSYERIGETAQIRPEDYVVVMTPGHRADYEVLRQALGTQACYIGCIGSRKKVAFVNGRLREDGFSETQIARIRAPIGLPILAETPEEIAVSITAQLILHRHGGLGEKT